MAYEIFVSYRSDDGPVAVDLENSLRVSWGYDGRVWRDEERLQAGSSWSNGIDTALDRAELVIAVIGKEWLSPTNFTRLLDSEDLVRRELVETLTAGKPVLPVVIDGLPIPRASQLPSELRSMFDVESVRISSEMKNATGARSSAP